MASKNINKLLILAIWACQMRKLDLKQKNIAYIQLATVQRDVQYIFTLLKINATSLDGN